MIRAESLTYQQLPTCSTETHQSMSPSPRSQDISAALTTITTTQLINHMTRHASGTDGKLHDAQQPGRPSQRPINIAVHICKGSICHLELVLIYRNGKKLLLKRLANIKP